MSNAQHKLTRGMFELNDEDLSKLQAAIDRSFEHLEAENENYVGTEITFFFNGNGRSIAINNSDVYQEDSVIVNV